MKKTLLFFALITVFMSYNLSFGQTFDLETKVSPDGSPKFMFGSDVSIDGDFAAISNPNDTVGVNEKQGVVYIYHKQNDGSWIFFQKITLSDGQPNAIFGKTISLNGNRLVVSTNSSVYLYEFDGTEWKEVQELIPSTGSQNNYGTSIAQNQNFIVIGAGIPFCFDCNKVFIFSLNNQTGEWENSQILDRSANAVREDDFGSSVAINDNYLVVGKPQNRGFARGAVYIHEWNGTEWVQTASIDSSAYNHLGRSVHLIGNNELIIESASSTFLYKASDDGWGLIQQFGNFSNSTIAKSIVSATQNYVAVGLPTFTVMGDTRRGMIDIYHRVHPDSIWLKEQSLIAEDGTENDWFGYAVAFSNSNLLVSAGGLSNNFGLPGNSDEGSAYFYNYSPLTGFSNKVTGRVFESSDDNCDFEEGYIARSNHIVSISGQNVVYYTVTDDSGRYELSLPDGDFSISVNNPQQMFFQLTCPSNSDFYEVQVNETNSEINNLNFVFSPIYENCASVEVKTFLSRKRPCRVGQSTIRYTNRGYVEAENAILTVSKSKLAHVISASMPFTWDSDSNMVFNLGNIPTQQRGTIVIRDSLPCEQEITGRAVCYRSEIVADNSCSPTSADWDESIVAVNGECVGDSLMRFTITNIGQEDMDSESTYRIYVDNILQYEGKFQLSTQEELTLQVMAGGQTIRIEADQLVGFPTNDFPSFSLEGCGAGIDGEISVSQIGGFPTNDRELNVSEECREVTNAFDPNDKQVFPYGISSQKFVKPETIMEYLIRFQNTGTDTAFQVQVVDTLSEYLDLSTLQIESTSHHSTFKVSPEGNILTFEFDNILLPDSTTDEANSHGYIKFNIKSFAAPNWTEVHNRAAIYFDFNSPIVTNSAWFTVHDTTLISDDLQRDADLTPPSGTFSTIEFDSNSFSNIVIDISFTESVTELEIDDFTIQNGKIISLEGQGDTYQVIVEPSALGTIQLILKESSVSDLSGNRNVFEIAETFVIASSLQEKIVLSTLIYPNPGSNSVNISLPWSKNTDTKIEVYEPSGRKVYEKNTNKTEFSLNLSSLPKGIYMLLVSNELGKVSKLWVKQ